MEKRSGALVATSGFRGTEFSSPMHLFGEERTVDARTPLWRWR
jgi:hypothetical protein